MNMADGESRTGLTVAVEAEAEAEVDEVRRRGGEVEILWCCGVVVLWC